MHEVLIALGLSDVSQLVEDPLHAAPPQFHVPPVYGVALLFPKCQMSPPRKMTWSPGAGVYEAHAPLQFGIPGACSHGVLLLVPLFVSEPFTAM